MAAKSTARNVASYLWKAPACGLVYMAAMAIGGALLAKAKIPPPSLPPGTDPKGLLPFTILASLTLAMAFGPVAAQLQGGYLTRWAILAAFAYISMGLNTAIESAIFTTLGGTPYVIAMFVLPCLAVAALAAALFRPARRGQPFSANLARHFSGRSAGAWAWRLVAAVLAFPLIYYFFGMFVGPWVAPYYRAGQYGLSLPSVPLIIWTQLVRSPLFVLAVLPVIVSWSGTRRQLAAALGIALYVLVGAFGLIQGYHLPAWMRALHGVEVLADSLVHGWVLAVLLGRAERGREPAPSVA